MGLVTASVFIIIGQASDNRDLSLQRDQREVMLVHVLVHLVSDNRNMVPSYT
jgi:hypothetical protein